MKNLLIKKYVFYISTAVILILFSAVFLSYSQETCTLPQEPDTSGKCTLPQEPDTSGKCTLPQEPDTSGICTTPPEPPVSIVDTTPPEVEIDQENWSLDNSITVDLWASDVGRGESNIIRGDLEVRINEGTWQSLGNYPSSDTGSSSYSYTYTYTNAVQCNRYEFRYRAEDAATVTETGCTFPQDPDVSGNCTLPPEPDTSGNCTLPPEPDTSGNCTLPPLPPISFLKDTFNFKILEALAQTGNLSNWVYDGVSIYDETPPQVTSPLPVNEATGVEINTSLSWTGSDNCGGSVTYDVHFGTAADPPFIISQTTTNYNPGTLDYETTYYWKIVARDEIGNENLGEVWSFTTRPESLGPDPFDELTLASPNCSSVVLSWSCSEEAETYAIYRDGTEILTIPATTSCNCGFPLGQQCSWTDTGLTENTQYSYYIQARNAFGQTNNSVPPECQNSAGQLNICSKSITTPFCAPSLPEPEAHGCGVIKIEWERHPAVEGYNILRSSKEGQDYQRIVSSYPEYWKPHCLNQHCEGFDINQEYNEIQEKSGCFGNRCIFFDKTIIPRVKYYYKISALSQEGKMESEFSEESIAVWSFCFKGPRWREK